MAYDEGLAERIRDILRDQQGISEKKMFGGLAFLVDGKMSVGVMGPDMMARVGKDGYASALERPHARAMDFTGRPMTGMVHVGAEGVSRDDDLRRWCDESVAFARTAEPSKPRKRATRSG